MSESKPDQVKKKKSPVGLIILLLVILAGLTGVWVYQKQKHSDYDVNAVAGIDAEQASDETTPKMTDGALDVASLSQPRILGDENAPLKIVEHSSFTCGACKNFHENNFKALKAQYIDTGKAYLVFDDFPRNLKDATVGAIARCVPDDAYFRFVQVTFETQSDWFNDLDLVKSNAVAAGADAELIEKCAESKELKEALATRAKNAFDNFGVNSTPSLILPGGVKVIGVRPYAEIEAAIENALAEIENDKVVMPEEDTPAPIEAAAGEETVDDASADENTADEDESTEDSVAIEEKESKAFDVQQASTPRILGDKNAPVKIVEHSSFTCPHCAHFHSDTYHKLKADYIDTGKAYLVFDDFPLKGADVVVGALARCVPESSYFKFVEFVFKDQQQWMANPKFVDYLKQNAQLMGASDAELQKCLDSQELQQAIALRGHNAYENKGVKGTPSLIINDGTPVNALIPYTDIKKIIDEELQKAAE
ncbi:MAG: thioredoxin domain-containing protein [Alcanivorax sp.]